MRNYHYHRPEHSLTSGEEDEDHIGPLLLIDWDAGVALRLDLRHSLEVQDRVD